MFVTNNQKHTVSLPALTVWKVKLLLKKKKNLKLDIH